ncbi:putative ferric-chelate reductase 1 homolog [Trichogramma pretiosum]|uniref:putative ferric-chelate reductase 1 homolog n=1 Tax=Trichogramma pretiosum TaxID=7493 RepID=UPI0006C9C928|nr:putative ferric-chelate reductase 1 homolog [Trichogramma pretiosum]
MTSARLAIGCLSWLSLLSVGVLGFGSGAPPTACDLMIPRHKNHLPQESPPPYQLLAARGQGRVRLIIGSPDGSGYRGFFVTARDIDTGEYVGEFNNLPESQAKHVECVQTDQRWGQKTAVTHIEPKNTKHNLEFDWEAPEDYEGTIVFNSTIARTYDVFWVGIESPRISVSKRSIDIHSTPASITVARSTTPPYFSPTPVNKMPDEQDPFYENCGETKNCFGIPDGCVEQQNCVAAVSVLVAGERYIFELRSTNNAKYVAVGLSDDRKMGDDSVVECVDAGDRVNMHMSWNDGFTNTRMATPPNTVDLISSSLVDGVISCKFSRNKLTQIQGRTFNLVEKPYFLLLARGQKVYSGGISYHDKREAWAEPRLLAIIGRNAGAGDLLVRLHGALMLAAWIGTTSIGMLLARYYRQTWVKSQLCGNDQWFAWHRFFMFLTWSMTMAAAVLIVIELQDWSSATYHAATGLATVVLCFIQPFMAAMRPHPGAPRRILFNWLHWFVGNAAHILALVAIFFAGRLGKANLPEWIDWILVAFIVFHVVTHFFLTFAGCASDKQGSQRVNSFPMKDVHARNSMTHPDSRRDAPHAGLRKLTFGIYFVVVVLFAAAYVVITIFAPIEESWNTFYDQYLAAQ